MGLGVGELRPVAAGIGVWLAATGAGLAQEVTELPLERGFYVRDDETCAAASPAGTALLRREGLQWVTSHCLFERIEQTGPASFTVTQACGDRHGAERAEARYELDGTTGFSFTDSNGWSHTARLCPQAQMPEPWRSADMADLIE